MNDKSFIVLLSILVGLVVILGVTFTFAQAAPFDDYSIPPTPAIKMINTTSGNVTANIYNDFIEFIAGVGMAITPNYANHEFTFTNTGGGLGGEGVSGRLGIWNDTSKLNSTSLLVWDFNNNFLNIANGHFLNSTHYNIGTSRILGSMTCNNAQQLQYQVSNNTWICVTPTSGEANTASNVGTDTGIFLQKVGVNLEFKSIRAGSNIAFTVYPNEVLINATGSGGVTTMESLTNVTDIGCALGQGLTVNSTAFWNCAPGGGNATILNNLGDVIISGSAIDHILQSDGVTYNNKLFKSDTDLNTTGTNNITFLTGHDNQTGDYTRKIYQDNTFTCGAGQFVSSYNNQTGVTTCTTPAGGGSGIPKPPKKWGEYMPVIGTIGVSQFGLLGGTLTLDGTETFQYNVTDQTNGISSVSGTTAGNNAGIAWLATDNDHYTGATNPYLYARFSTNETTSNRLFIGLQSGTTAMPNNNDSVILSISGVGLCINATSTVYNFCHNDGDAVTNDISFGVTELAKTVHYVEIYSTNAGVTWCGKLDGGTEVCSSVEIPASATRLRAVVNAETSTASGTILVYYHVYTENDK